MIYQKQEQFIADLEKTKNPQALIEDLANRLSKSKDKQTEINILYHQLSVNGTKNLDKLINIYNKKYANEHVKTYAQVMSDYQNIIKNASDVFLKSGHRYGKENLETDKELREKFNTIIKPVKPECMQDVVNEINKYIDDAIVSQKFSLEKDTLCVNAFKAIVNDFGDRNLIRLYTYDINVVDNEVKKMKDVYKNAKDVKEFKEAMYKLHKTIEPSAFQAVVNRLDKELSFQGSKAVDSAVQSINNHSDNKFETRRVILTEREKDNSWQKFEHETILSKKLRELNERLQEIKKNRERPNNKYDKNFISSTMRVLTNLQNVIAETADFIRTHIIEYYASLNKEKEQEDLKQEPFYEVMKEAYKEKGRVLVNGINTGTLTREEAQKLFIMDVSYIKTQNTEHQAELFNSYAQNITSSLRESGIKSSTKNIMYTIIANYEQNKFDKDIEFNIKNGCHWDDVCKNQPEKDKPSQANIKQKEKSANKDETKPKPKEITVDEIIYAFNNNKNPEPKFTAWLKGKNTEAIQAGVYQIDKAIDSPESCFRFIDSLTSNGLQNIQAPHCDMVLESQFEIER